MRKALLLLCLKSMNADQNKEQILSSCTEVQYLNWVTCEDVKWGPAIL